MNQEVMRVFIGSSVEGLKIANAIHENLEHTVEATVWSQGIFGPSDYTLDKLTSELNKYDFAIFVFSFEDVTMMRNKELITSRDNVIFEFGLFVGRLGRERCYFVMPRSKEELHLPTDFLGITPAFYNPIRTDGNLLSALGPACNQLIRSFQEHGKRGDRHDLEFNDVKEQIKMSGFSGLYQSRDDYGKYRKDSPTIDRYVATANESIDIISINLITGLQVDGLGRILNSKLEASHGNMTATISLLNPMNMSLMEALSPVLDTSPEKLSNAIRDTLEELVEMRDNINGVAKEQFDILVHNSIPLGSAIMLDVNSGHGKIQIETKAYKEPVRKSFGFEITDNGTSDIFNTLKNGYSKLLKDAEDYQALLSPKS